MKPHSSRLCHNLQQSGLLEPLEFNDSAATSAWADWDLAILVENRCQHEVDPRGWAAEERQSWRKRCLLPTERCLEPEAWREFFHFWVCAESERVGIVAVKKPEFRSRDLFVGSLYILPPFRGKKWGHAVLNWIQQVGRSLGYSGIQLETDLQWLPAVRYYLHHQFWWLEGKERLVLSQNLDFPKHRFVLQDSLAMFQIYEARLQAVLYAEWLENKVHWEESPRLLSAGLRPIREMALNTFRLYLMLEGWPQQDFQNPTSPMARSRLVAGHPRRVLGRANAS